MPLNNYTIYQEPLIHLKTWESLPSVNYQQDILTHINQQLVDTSLMLLHNCLRQNRLIFFWHQQNAGEKKPGINDVVNGLHL